MLHMHAGGERGGASGRGRCASGGCALRSNLPVCRFEKAMAAAKAISRAAGRSAATDGLKFEAHATAWLKDAGIAATDDDPKFEIGEDCECKVMAIMTASENDSFVQSLLEGERGSEVVGVVLDRTSFYAESGGQTTDTGTIELPVRSAAAPEALQGTLLAWRCMHRGTLHCMVLHALRHAALHGAASSEASCIASCCNQRGTLHCMALHASSCHTRSVQCAAPG